jgi:hypothetical protein
MKKLILITLAAIGCILSAQPAAAQQTPQLPPITLIEQPSQGEPTITEKQQRVVSQYKAEMQRLFGQMRATHDRLFREFWQNRSGLTPQQVSDAFGTEAVQVFILGGALKDFLNMIRPGTVTATPPFEFTPNADGTVTIGAPVATPSPTPAE